MKHFFSVLNFFIARPTLSPFVFSSPGVKNSKREKKKREDLLSPFSRATPFRVIHYGVITSEHHAELLTKKKFKTSRRLALITGVRVESALA